MTDFVTQSTIKMYVTSIEQDTNAPTHLHSIMPEMLNNPSYRMWTSHILWEPKLPRGTIILGLSYLRDYMHLVDIDGYVIEE